MAKGRMFLSELARGDKSINPRSRSFPMVQLSGTMTENKVRFLSMRAIKFFKAASRLLTHAPARCYGSSALSFGAVTLILYFARLSADMSIFTPMLGAFVAFLAIPFLLSEKPIPLVLQDFEVTDYIFFEFFCIKRFSKLESAERVPIILSVFVGMLMALLGVVMPVWYVLLAELAFVFVGITLSSPEFAFFASFLILPYMNLVPYSSLVFAAIILLTVLSFARKAIFGKRVFCIDGYDLLIGILMIVILVSGIFIKGMSSFTWSLGMLIMGFGYTIANNVVANRRLADRAFNALVISSLPPAAVAIASFIRTLSLGGGSALVDVGVFYPFSSTGTAAIFMAVSALFSIAILLQSHGMKKAFYSATFALEFCALILTGEMLAVAVFVLGVSVYSLMRAFRGGAYLLPVLAIAPYGILLLPTSALDRLFSVIPSLESAGELFRIWGASLRAFLENIVFGIGIGGESFAEEMAGAEIIGTNSSNLFIELALEAGIVALVCILSLLVIRVFHRANYHSFVKNSEVSVISPVCSVCTFVLIAYGAFNYVFSDLLSTYLFWCIFGIGSAALRVAKRETDDRIHYYEDTRARNSSSIDIEIL